MLGRGCPYSCNFCSAEAYRRLYRGIGSYVRIRTVTSVISELSDIKNRYHPTCFFFHDDTFTCDADYSKEFIEKYRKEINLPFSCLLRADLVSDSYIGLLKSAGCYLVAFGVESGDQALRSKVLKKNISDQQILDCAKLLHKHEIPFATFNMVGLPGESLDQVWETVNLNASLKPAWAWFSLYQTLPHTALADYAISEGYAQSVDVASSDANFHENSNLLRNHVEGHQISRLKSCSNIVIKFPMLKGVICRVVIRCPFDAVFNLIEKLMYFVCYYKRLTYNMSILDAVKSAFFIYRHIKEFK
jgi:hypothetical protein